MDVEIHQCRVDVDEQATVRERTSGEHLSVSVRHCLYKGIVLYRTSVDEDRNTGTVAAVQGR